LNVDLPDVVVISPNDPDAMKRYVVECKQMNIPFIYDPSQQIVRMTGAELCAGIEGARALFVNDYEFALVQKMTGISPEDILRQCKFLVVTRGREGASVYADGAEYHIPVVPAEHIADPTGVGDAFRGGFLTAYASGLDWLTCGRVGVLAATYCLEQSGPQGHAYTPAEFIARYQRHFDDANKLENLLSKDNS
jgi:adenosine kinase